ncbi:MAG: phosphatidylglycerophosphatase A [Opitutales bacterium]|nr:phosphatidylglycerophosphatase A [Opitutales bacterium]MCH8541764.1 phosphatidylglycerophosphatase A [Opitutales bacterium]
MNRRLTLLSLLPPRWIVQVATLGPIGQKLKAPGTWGSVVGFLWFTLLFAPMGEIWLWVFGSLTVLAAVAICGEAEIIMGKRDPGEIILDEMVAVPFCFVGIMPLLHSDEFTTPPAWVILILAFLLFRFFDILKPLGIRRSQKLPRGWGVVIDDVLAALATAACLHLIIYFT